MAQEYLKKVQVTTQIAAPVEPLIFDDFEGILKWTGSGDGAFTVEKSTDRARGGGNSLHIETRAADAAIGDFVQAGIFLPVRPQRYLSFLAFLLIPAVFSDVIVSLNFWAKYNNLEHKASIFYDNDDGNIGYANKDENPQWFPARATGLMEGAIGEIELIVDTALKEYVSLRINQTVIDMKGTPYFTDDFLGSGSYLIATLKIVTSAASASDMYFDDVLIKYIG